MNDFYYYRNAYPTLSAKERYDIYVKDYKNNPLYWTNNKRKKCGLSVLRKKQNIKRRYEIKKFYNCSYFFLEDIANEVLDNHVVKWFDNLVNVKDIEEGE